MNRTDSPTKQGVPFGVNGNREPIEATTPAGDNSASYDVGFPPITMILKAAGGLPPKGQDMNQILFELSSLARWASAGAINRFDSAFSAAIGGYPQDAQVLGSDGKTVWRSSVNNNTNDPNSVTTGWIKVADDIASILSLGTAAYRAVGVGTNQIPDISSFVGGVGTNSGHFKVPMANGVTMQVRVGRVLGSSSSDVSVNFAIPFTTNVTAWSATCDYTVGTGNIGYAAAVANTNGITIRASGNFSVVYIAIGY
jgi:hypothetical protein